MAAKNKNQTKPKEKRVPLTGRVLPFRAVEGAADKKVDWRRMKGFEMALTLPEKPADALIVATAMWEAYLKILAANGLP